MAEIKNCPFCGSAAELKTELVASKYEYYFVQCTKCEVHTPIKLERAKAIEIWNSRGKFSQIF